MATQWEDIARKIYVMVGEDLEEIQQGQKPLRDLVRVSSGDVFVGAAEVIGGAEDGMSLFPVILLCGENRAIQFSLTREAAKELRNLLLQSMRAADDRDQTGEGDEW